MVETGEEAMAQTKVAMEIKVRGSMEENVVVVVEAMVETEMEASEETGEVHAMEETEWLWRRPRWLWRQNGRKKRLQK
ncbi:hypothetical protein SUZIE_141300 [Sciurus carolinensis]|uniref:Uncharacterized protein n=1 Tax=Sciurus carolinensis TaxID=30640 RepID=A0AA41SXS1_SCICA|nr:hypothetical protein [Sciurus carolinensis]